MDYIIYKEGVDVGCRKKCLAYEIECMGKGWKKKYVRLTEQSLYENERTQ